MAWLLEGTSVSLRLRRPRSGHRTPLAASPTRLPRSPQSLRARPLSPAPPRSRRFRAPRHRSGSSACRPPRPPRACAHHPSRRSLPQRLSPHRAVPSQSARIAPRRRRGPGLGAVPSPGLPALRGACAVRRRRCSWRAPPPRSPAQAQSGAGGGGRRVPLAAAGSCQRRVAAAAAAAPGPDGERSPRPGPTRSAPRRAERRALPRRCPPSPPRGGGGSSSAPPPGRPPPAAAPLAPAGPRSCDALGLHLSAQRRPRPRVPQVPLLQG